jgi:hypothetical protein
MITICDCETKDCVICLDNLINDKDEILILECNHLFHKRCFYNSIKDKKYKCPFRCNISINNCLQLISKHKYIEKIVKNVKIPLNIETILNIVDWSKRDTFIAGGFALSLYKNFTIAYSDIDFMTTNIRSINMDILLYKNYGIETHYNNNKYISFNTNNLVDYYDNNTRTIHNTYTKVINKIEDVIKLKNKTLDSEYIDIDIVKLQSNYHNKTFKLSLENDIYDTLNSFDISCCKIAFTYNNDNEFIFYIHPDYYNNRAYINKKDISNGLNTLKRIEKYKNKGIVDIEVINI